MKLQNLRTKQGFGEAMEINRFLYCLLKSIGCLAIIGVFGCSSARRSPHEEGSIKLAWDPPSTPESAQPKTISGYKILGRKHKGSSVLDVKVDVGNILTYRVSGLERGEKYCFIIVSYTPEHIESEASTQICSVAN